MAAAQKPPDGALPLDLLEGCARAGPPLREAGLLNAVPGHVHTGLTAGGGTVREIFSLPTPDCRTRVTTHVGQGGTGGTQ